MDKNGLRPVRWIEAVSENGRMNKKAFSGWFHCFATDADKDTFAIVEKENGTVSTIYDIDYMQFLDRSERGI